MATLFGAQVYQSASILAAVVEMTLGWQNGAVKSGSWDGPAGHLYEQVSRSQISGPNSPQSPGAVPVGGMQYHLHYGPTQSVAVVVL